MTDLVVLAVVELHALGQWVQAHAAGAHLVVDHHVVVLLEVHQGLPWHALHQRVHVTVGEGTHVLAHHHVVVIIHFVVPAVLTLTHVAAAHHHVFQVSLQNWRHVVWSKLGGTFTTLQRHLVWVCLLWRLVCLDHAEAADFLASKFDPALIL